MSNFNNTEILKNDLLNEQYSVINHPSGLRIYIFQKLDFNTSYAIIGTKYGSINRTFKLGDEIVETPAGIAHFLEHKLFECKEGDAFTLFSKTGASSNAYTSFEKTAYLFSCSENFKESLKILMNFVQEPYFTEKGIQKERGIIEQEIKMYEDSPDWQSTINLLSSLYHKHPVNCDIAGSVESISNITTDLMNKCYDAFYRLSNMTLCLVGNFNRNDILEYLDKLIVNRSHDKKVESIFPDEPLDIKSHSTIKKMEVINPLFSIGFKHSANENITCEDLVKYEFIIKLISLNSGDLYSKLLDKGLISANNLDCTFFHGPYYSSSTFSGESKDPNEVFKIIQDEVSKLPSKISEDVFERTKKCLYSDIVSIFDSPSLISNQLLSFDFLGFSVFDFINNISSISIDEIKEFMKNFSLKNSSISIINPIR